LRDIFTDAAVFVGSGKGVLPLNEQPLLILPLHAHEMKLPAKFFATKDNAAFPRLNLLDEVSRCNKLIVSTVPNHDIAGPVIALGNMPDEMQILDRMVLHPHGEAFLSGIERRTFGDRPRLEYSSSFDPEVVMETRGVVLVDDKPLSVLSG
jgi:hypothetical protein